MIRRSEGEGLELPRYVPPTIEMSRALVLATGMLPTFVEGGDIRRPRPPQYPDPHVIIEMSRYAGITEEMYRLVMRALHVAEVEVAE